MITLIGKVLVFVHLVLSLVFAAVAVGLYTNRMDWPGPAKAVAGPAAEGEYKKRQADFTEWDRIVGQNERRWNAQRTALEKAETQRPLEQQWYADQVKILEGDGLKPGPIQELVYKSGRLQLDKSGLPALQAVPGLQSRTALQQAINATKKEIDDQLKEIDKLLQQERALSLQINGERGSSRGLRDLIAEEQKAKDSMLAETERIKPLRVNRQVEAQLLLKRKSGLEARLKELEARAAAPGTP